jgi:hypothetical protein
MYAQVASDGHIHIEVLLPEEFIDEASRRANGR